ncbi:MAG TPA: hypothetical protein VJV05_09780 [Pyrinomonadaceae bacterium]|nr:hypothetical protein [Pyrinomonadaceae bacterium]
MKKLIGSALILGSIAVVAPVAEAATSSSVSTTAVSSVQQPERWRYGRRASYTVTRTRIVRVGYRRYRETYRTTYFRNGRTQTRVITRVRVR